MPPDPPDLSDTTPRSRRSRAELRQATLEEARKIILADGPEALTARRLAEAVGYTPGTIYNLFDSLPDVLWQVNRSHFTRIAALYDDLPGDSPQIRLQTVAARYLHLVRTEPTLYRSLFDGPRRSEHFPEWYHEAINQLLDLTADELVAIAPEMSRQTARHEAVAIFAAIQGIAQLSSSGRLDLLTDQGAGDLAQGLMTRILRDMTRQGG